MELTDRRLLIEHLNRLEQQAATVAALLDFDDAELMQEVADAFAPPPVNVVRDQKARRRWGAFWLNWLVESGDRWEERPPAHPDGEVMAALLLSWARS